MPRGECDSVQIPNAMRPRWLRVCNARFTAARQEVQRRREIAASGAGKFIARREAILAAEECAYSVPYNRSSGTTEIRAIGRDYTFQKHVSIERAGGMSSVRAKVSFGP